MKHGFPLLPQFYSLMKDILQFFDLTTKCVRLCMHKHVFLPEILDLVSILSSAWFKVANGTRSGGLLRLNGPGV